MSQKAMEAYMKKIYYDPSHSAGYSSIDRLTRAVKLKFPKASYGKTKKWLLSQTVYSTSRPANKTVNRGSTVTPGLGVQVQADLVDFARYSKENQSWRYILVYCDVFSRFAWTRKLRTKTPSEVSDALKDIFDTSRIPIGLRVDAGAEFTAAICRKLYSKYNVELFIARSETKSSIVERLIKSLKQRIFKVFMSRGNHTWIDIFESVTKAYNGSYHRMISMRPEDVTEETENLCRILQYFRTHKVPYTPMPSKKKKKESKDEKKSNPKPPQPKFPVGSQVRISSYKNKFTREFDIKWSIEIYTVKSCYLRQGVYVYQLQDSRGEPIVGKFYKSELDFAKTPQNEMYSVEEILKTRGKGKNKQYLIKWLGYPRSEASWVDAKDLRDIESITK